MPILAASIAASIGREDGAFFASLKYATLGGLCGGGFCIGLAMLGVTGAHRALLPVYFQAAYQASGVMQHATAPRGVPAIFPIAVVGAVAGIFTFTAIGAAVGAEMPGGDSSSATLLRALLGGALGMAPVAAWWVFVRKRAGKRIRVVAVVMAACLSLICVAVLVGSLNGALAPAKLDYDTLYKRAVLRHEQRDWDKAIADYSGAIKRNPKSEEALLGRGNARQDKGDLDGAIADFNSVIAINPKSADAFYNRGNARHLKGDQAGAVTDYTKAIEISPEWDSPYINRADDRRLQGDLQGAIADSSKAIELNGKEPYPYCTRGLALLELGKEAEAQKDFDRFVQLNPSLEGNMKWEIQQVKKRRQPKR
jgi:tetratricopeptide (TPR) repeat protein